MKRIAVHASRSIMGCLVLCTASAQEPGIGQVASQREEGPHDPYLSGPGPRPENYVKRVGPVVRDGFVNVQVNVDALGENIPGDAANEPSIAVDPTNPDRIVIGWRQFDNVNSSFRQAGWAYSHDRGKTWTFPGVIEPGVFRSDPVLAADADGNFHYYSLTDTATTPLHCDLFTSFDGGVTWSLKTNGLGGDKPWMVIDTTDGPGRNHIYVYWNANATCCSGQFVRSTDGGLTFGDLRYLTGHPHYGTLTVDPDGELYTAGFTVGVTLIRVERSINARYASATVNFVSSALVDLRGAPPDKLKSASGTFSPYPNPDGLFGQPWVATDHSNSARRGFVYLLGSIRPYQDDPLDVMFMRSEDHGVTWSEPVRVNDDPPAPDAWQWFGMMSVAPNGRIDAVWNDTRNSDISFECELYYSYSIDGGISWSPNVAVSPVFDSSVGWPQQNKLGDYYHMISDDWGVNIAYAATFNHEEDIYFLRIPMDCNDNGVMDYTDVKSGTSADCNGDQRPDECEPNTDCNGNGIQDICDLAAGVSKDCNENHVPDECEPQNDCNGNHVQDIFDVAFGTSEDCDRNAVPDECDPDCNGNGLVDFCETRDGVTEDCNFNHIPDVCEVAEGEITDCNNNGLLDECEAAHDPCGPPSAFCPRQGDCLNPLGLPGPGCDCSICCQRVCDIAPVCCNARWLSMCSELAQSLDVCQPPEIIDCNDNSIPDDCEPDCNGNSIPDDCEIAEVGDCNGNAILDGCEPDCNHNGVPDDCDLHDHCGEPQGLCPGEGDCCSPFGNGTPGCSCSSCCAEVCAALPSCCTVAWDGFCAYLASSLPSCDCAGQASRDCNENAVPDECELRADADGDGALTIADWINVRDCMIVPCSSVGCAPDQAADRCCSRFDYQNDGDVDLRDIRVWLLDFSP